MDHAVHQRRAFLLGVLLHLAVAAASLATPPPACAAPPPPEKVLHATRLETPPRIDGRVEEECWTATAPVAGFVQYDPANGAPASEETQAWVAYDRDNVYFAFVLKDSHPDRIWAELTPRNGYRLNDSITVILDTYHDRRTSIEFTVNARGVQRNSVETIWKSEVARRPDGWSAEIAIPFKSLRFAASDEAVWGVNFERYISRLGERDYWTTVLRDKPMLMQMGELRGLSNSNPGHNVELFPYAGARTSRWAGEADDKLAGGLDVKYGIRSNLVLDLTASPDFSQVESDPFIYQLSPYENHLSEHRPFFTEGSGYFRTATEGYGGFGGPQFSLFYSRRIGDPAFAAKLTGKAGGWSVGLMGGGNDDEERGVEPFAALRVQKDVLGDSRVGLFFTGIGADEGNRNVAADYRLRYKDIYSLTGLHAVTFNGSGDGGQNTVHMVRFDRSPDAGWSSGLSFDRIGKDVAVGTGFVSRTDVQSTSGRAGYAWRMDGQHVKRVSVSASGTLLQDTGGTVRGKTVGVDSWVSLRPEMDLSLSASAGRSRPQVSLEDGSLAWTDRFLDTAEVWAGIFWSRGGFLKGVHANVSWENDAVYLDDFSRVEAGRQLESEVSLTFRPRSDVEFEVGGEYVRQRVNRTGELAFSGLTYDASLHYQMTRSLFFSTRLQGESRDEQYNLDIVAGYYFGAGNAAQVACKKGSRLGDTLRENGYSVTAKVSYLLRL